MTWPWTGSWWLAMPGTNSANCGGCKEHPGVEEAYEQAIAFGQVAQPGLALYRLSQGDVQAADAGLHRVLAEREQAVDRLVLLEAAVEVDLAAGRIDSAEDAVTEMERIAKAFPTTAHAGHSGLPLVELLR